MTFLGAIHDDSGKETCRLYHGTEEWNRTLFSPDITETAVCILGIPDKVTKQGYKAIKSYISDKAKDAQDLMSIGTFTWSDMVEIGNWFAKQGKRYGLLKEFRENGIC